MSKNLHDFLDLPLRYILHTSGKTEGILCWDSPFPTFPRILEALRIEWRNSTPRFSWTPKKMLKKDKLCRISISVFTRCPSVFRYCRLRVEWRNPTSRCFIIKYSYYCIVIDVAQGHTVARVVGLTPSRGNQLNKYIILFPRSHKV